MKAGREKFQMVFTLGEDDRRASLRQSAPHVVQDEAIAVLIGRQLGIEPLDTIHGHRAVATERRLANDQPVVEWTARRLVPGFHGEAHRTELHLRDRM
jgi:hypothetical protein